jgi:long-chain acyl-CoA synthetase
VVCLFYRKNNSKTFFFEEILMYYMGIKVGYSSPQTLTDQSTAIKRGEKGDIQVLRPHIMSCVPV